jgi:hypothetical protein
VPYRIAGVFVRQRSIAMPWLFSAETEKTAVSRACSDGLARHLQQLSFTITQGNGTSKWNPKKTI